MWSVDLLKRQSLNIRFVRPHEQHMDFSVCACACVRVFDGREPVYTLFMRYDLCISMMSEVCLQVLLKPKVCTAQEIDCRGIERERFLMWVPAMWICVQSLRCTCCCEETKGDLYSCFHVTSAQRAEIIDPLSFVAEGLFYVWFVCFAIPQSVSLSLSLCLSVSLSLCLSVCLSLSFSLFLFVLSLSVCLSLFLCLSSLSLRAFVIILSARVAVLLPPVSFGPFACILPSPSSACDRGSRHGEGDIGHDLLYLNTC